MSKKMTRDEFLQKIFKENYRPGMKDKLRTVKVRVPGRDMTLAHIVGVSSTEVYQNLGLHIGVHAGEDHTGDALGILKFTPWECTVVSADIALKQGSVEIGFMDRFSGALILTGQREEIRSAIEGIRNFFRDELHFPVCDITES